MKSIRRAAGWCALGLGLTMAAASGCQTWEGGMTLPTGRYLEHPPQFFPSDPVFPLERELAAQQATYAQGLPGGPPAGLPGPVPGGAGRGGQPELPPVLPPPEPGGP
jgi:hypothetical protein